MTSKTSTPRKNRPGTGSIHVSVHDGYSNTPIANAVVSLYEVNAGIGFNADWNPSQHHCKERQRTHAHGGTTFHNLGEGPYVVQYEHYPPTDPAHVPLGEGDNAQVHIGVSLGCAVEVGFESPDCKPLRCETGLPNQHAVATISFYGSDTAEGQAGVEAVGPIGWRQRAGNRLEYVSGPLRLANPPFEATLRLAHIGGAGAAALTAAPGDGGDGRALAKLKKEVPVDEPVPTPISGNVGVALTRTETEPTEDLPLWTLIRNSTEALSFTNYLQFMDDLFCHDNLHPHGSKQFQQLKKRRFLPFTDADAYRVLKVATEAFVMVNCGVLNQLGAFNPVEDNAYLDRRDIPAPARDLSDVLSTDYLEKVDGVPMLPYLAVIRRKLPDIPITVPHGREPEVDLCFGIIQERLRNPCLLELIWSYWQEEGMLVQSMNAITQRFQNLRSPTLVPDPLANTEIDMLRPLNNLLWGYTQDEQHRLTVMRRNYEYDHHYGVRLDGKAVQRFRPADSRSKFLEAFHHLLRMLTAFYKQDDDTTVKADAFPILNALKEVHLILSQGAHNQFGDLPSTARIEMLMQQWLLARPEFREFLPTRIMVAYPEPWMDRVDAMKKIQGWTDTSVMHFRNMAMFGEQLLLSIRYGNWSDIYEPTQAFNWSRFWRPQVQGYIHAYRAATGVDLSAELSDPKTEAMLPSVLLRQRLAAQQSSVS